MCFLQRFFLHFPLIYLIYYLTVPTYNHLPQPFPILTILTLDEPTLAHPLLQLFVWRFHLNASQRSINPPLLTNFSTCLSSLQPPNVSVFPTLSRNTHCLPPSNNTSNVIFSTPYSNSSPKASSSTSPPPKYRSLNSIYAQLDQMEAQVVDLDYEE